MPKVSSSTQSHSRKQRSSGACDFCRRRKLGCDNAKPKCENCAARAGDCVYSHREKRARPSHALFQRLSHEANTQNSALQQEITRLHNELEALRENSNEYLRSQTLRSDEETHPSDLTNTPEASQPGIEVRLGTPENTPVIEPKSRNDVLPGREAESQFHGPSSFMSEGKAPDHSERSNLLNEKERHIKDNLLALAIKQRQMESMNLHSGKLDFDGTDPELGMKLLSVFWNRQHYSGSIVYRPTFMRDMACGGPYFSRLLLNAIFFVASKYLARTDTVGDPSISSSQGLVYRRKFEQHLYTLGSGILCKSTITTVQAFLITGDALFSWCDERSLSWHYIGIAINMIVDLGIHSEGSDSRAISKGSHADSEIRRRVFWAAFILDKMQSTYQGRPPRLREVDNRVPISFLDDYEELEQFNTLTYAIEPRQLCCPTYSNSTFEQLGKLSIIMDRILCNLYAETSSVRDPVALLQISYTLYDELRDWQANLPTQLQVRLDEPQSSTILPHTISLLSMYYALVILLHRPFVSDGHLQTASEQAASQAFSVCTAAAWETHRLNVLYQKHFCPSTVPYFMSYAIYVSGTIHVRLAAQRPPNSEPHKYLRNCLNVLQQQRAKCYAPRRAMQILLRLAKQLGVDVNVAGYNYHNTPSCFANEHLGESEIARHIEIPQSIRLQGNSQIESNPNLFRANDEAFDFDPAVMDFDIDEIMKSFGSVTGDPERSLTSKEGAFMPQTSTEPPGFEPVSLSADNADFEFGGWDSGISIDPLFGLGLSPVEF